MASFVQTLNDQIYFLIKYNESKEFSVKSFKGEIISLPNWGTNKEKKSFIQNYVTTHDLRR